MNKLVFGPSKFAVTPPAPVSILKEAWGAVTAGSEPWRNVVCRHIARSSVCYNQKTKGLLEIVAHANGTFSFTTWGGITPDTLSKSLLGETPFETLFDIPGMDWSGGPVNYTDAAAASQAFVRWCELQ